MPFKSRKQAAFFFAAANKKNGLDGLSKQSAQNFIKDTHGQKLASLPEYKTPQPEQVNKFKRIKKYFTAGGK